jgi:transposase
VAVALTLSPGNESDYEHFDPLYQQLEGITTPALVMDKGYDSDNIRDAIKQDKRKPVIPPRSNRTVQYRYDKTLYKLRNMVERLFNKLKHYRRIATRYDKLARTFLAAVQIILTLLCLR